MIIKNFYILGMMFCMETLASHPKKKKLDLIRRDKKIDEDDEIIDGDKLRVIKMHLGSEKLWKMVAEDFKIPSAEDCWRLASKEFRSEKTINSFILWAACQIDIFKARENTLSTEELIERENIIKFKEYDKHMDLYMAHMQARSQIFSKGLQKEREASKAESERDRIINAEKRERDSILSEAERERDSILSEAKRERDSILSAEKREMDSIVSAEKREMDSIVSKAKRERDSIVSAEKRERDSILSAEKRERDSILSAEKRERDRIASEAERKKSRIASEAERKKSRIASEAERKKSRIASKAEHKKECAAHYAEIKASQEEHEKKQASFKALMENKKYERKIKNLIVNEAGARKKIESEFKVDMEKKKLTFLSQREIVKEKEKEKEKEKKEKEKEKENAASKVQQIKKFFRTIIKENSSQIEQTVQQTTGLQIHLEPTITEFMSE